MNSKHAEALPAPLTSLDHLVREREQLQPASTISPDSDHSVVYTNNYTMAFCSDYDSLGWNIAPQSLAIDSPFLSDLIISAQKDTSFD
ncbi:hypothetical protein ED733_000197 [Metarhizium rileyi]|uniref:Uncharacterized protein n=1 Tax=Metarhizium rileyi (strain RCEF 4871) TaxID=1649241 RepID=A0A5C6G3P3_METRR|nr:hypothetical protein ED733_000197 [Metarhizium rileyi]